MAGSPSRHTTEPGVTGDDNPQDSESTGFAGWLDARLPVISAFRNEYIRFPMPRSLNALWTVGAMLTVVLVLMLLSGLALAMNYTPTAAGAFASVEAIERRLPAGWLLRSMHMTGASLFLAALYVHLFRGLYYGSYKAPREILWIIGVALLAMVMVTAFAGYVLPWGQMSYWGADVAGKAVGAVPGIGPFLERLFLGGDQPGDVTLHHLFVLHFTLAFGIVGVVGLHVAALHVAGPGNPTGIPAKEPEQTLPFHPYFTVKDGLGLVVFAILFAAVLFFLPGLISEPENYRPANPMHTPTDIEPEWYFLPFYGILQSIPSKFGGLVVSVGAILLLFLTPWLDTSPIRSARNRPVYRIGMIALVVAFVLLGFAGKHHVEGAWLYVGQLATLYYYLHFLVLMPLVSRRENAALAYGSALRVGDAP
ncbi:cytochrome b [Acetobacter oeni]|uniref:Cytochrome b n=1 Tax=Acetobacter oeni TaxID=304077 RepID=A0A511XLD8_9PROT|nr:cytochrome b N-terminal domain-containing protein [Acetobacter oeni]MBB3883535.1 ubiquinol-cytochrome c reductase cytochrome b subunit [Acetobacter oeni]NHO19574.1 cytochrome b [Acetobacter oeni]GBR03091.1 ubiquinol-cytochrome c reductase cytochrome b subunit [Acetobacter oeni LMG 21952]GEN63756.1 cytochrome b [Acetobacter oeni]